MIAVWGKEDCCGGLWEISTRDREIGVGGDYFGGGESMGWEGG